MMQDRWFATGERAVVDPPNNEVVVIIRSDGSSEKMKYSSGLWFMEPDFKVYTYFTPPFWRYLREDEQ